MLFNEDISIDGKEEALKLLQIWRVRRAQDTPLGVLCTFILLDVQMKDLRGEVKDNNTLSTLYGCAITKFINYASSFNSYRGSMYGTADNLGIDSFLIDLRHNFAHGKQTPNLEVFRQSHSMCMKWIKEFYWDKEEMNIENVEIKKIRSDIELDKKLDEIFLFYNMVAELVHKNIKNFEMLEVSDEKSTDRWPFVKKFMNANNLVNFRQAFNHFTNQLVQIIESRSLRSNPEAFFYSFLNKCDYFMNAHQIAAKTVSLNIPDELSDEEVTITPVKKRKTEKIQSIVNLFQDLIWHIAKNDYLKIFLNTLFQINFNRGESQVRRQSARFWILIILRSFNYYIKYCKFQKSSNFTDQKKITDEVRNVYSYQLDADLRNVLIFVGTQMLPSSLKFTKDFVLNILENISDDDDYAISISLLPLINPQLSKQQKEEMQNLVDIKLTKKKRGVEKSADKIYTINDLNGEKRESTKTSSNDPWQLASGNIEWASFPIGHEFKI